MIAYHDYIGCQASLGNRHRQNIGNGQGFCEGCLFLVVGFQSSFVNTDSGAPIQLTHLEDYSSRLAMHKNRLYSAGNFILAFESPICVPFPFLEF